MQKKALILLCALLCLGAGYASAQMTDDAILTYFAQGTAAGKSNTQIGNELLAKGVSASQIQRLMKQFQSTGMNNTYMATTTSKLDEIRPTRDVPEDEDEVSKVRPKTEENEKQKKDTLDTIFGQDLFNNKTLSFEPNVNAATPADYVLGPGDEIVIDIWGMNEATIKQEISPEGRIIVSQVGAIDLNGLTIEQATSKIKRAFAKRYAGIGGVNPASQISVTLGKIRSIQVNIMGNVQMPGTYRLSSFTTVFNALYKAGGVTSSGSLRCVKVMRGGELAAVVDIYSFIFNGRQDVNISLKEGDVILVPPYQYLINIKGGVKKPMFYELKEGETVQDLIDYAGGFTGDAYRDEAKVVRYDGLERHMYSVSSANFSTYKLQDADEVTVTVTSREQELYANKVEVRGAVYRPGLFELGGEIATVKQLVEHAGGLLDDAFLNRAQIIREKSDRSLELHAVPLGGIMKGTVDDILLRKNDVLVISSVTEIDPKGDLTITGYVNNPGKYEFADNMTVEDLILIAGGLNEGASSVNVEVARRINEADSFFAPDTIAHVFSFGIKDGLMVDGQPDFILKPYDVVSVRRSPSYIEQQNVSITGEVTFPGQYTLTNNNYRVSELLARAGGPTPDAHVHGAMLKRKISQYERNVRTGISRMAAQQDKTDSIKVDKLKVSEIYTVGLELDKAIANPGSDYDIILRDGDELIVPEKTTTVRVQGEVMYPNTVHYISGKPVGYYVRQAGGYSESSRRSKVYVLYMNGTVATGFSAKVEPGCEIIVPKKPEREKITASEIMSIGSSAASIAAVVATIVNLTRK